MDNSTSLTQLYDNLKKDDRPMGGPTTPIRPLGGPKMDPIIWKRKVAGCCNNLVDKCRKHIILDIYCKILPFDQKYIDGNQGQCANDVDCMLKSKGMTPTQYLTSCYESTHAPLLEYILRATEMIGKSYMEEAEEVLKDAEQNGKDLQEPQEPETDDPDVEDQLVDVKNDIEYDTFIDTLKKKTIDKIVADVSALIDKSKDENDMTFDTDDKPTQEPTQESVVGVGLDYLHTAMWKSGHEFTEAENEEMIGMAIREATLHQLDVVFNLPGKEYREYASMINYGKGIIINESALELFDEYAGREDKAEIKEIKDNIRGRVKRILTENNVEVMKDERLIGGYPRDDIKLFQVMWKCYVDPKNVTELEGKINTACAKELGEKYRVSLISQRSQSIQDDLGGRGRKRHLVIIERA